jgi:hypothetical protein
VCHRLRAVMLEIFDEVVAALNAIDGSCDVIC